MKNLFLTTILALTTANVFVGPTAQASAAPTMTCSVKAWKKSNRFSPEPTVKSISLKEGWGEIQFVTDKYIATGYVTTQFAPVFSASLAFSQQESQGIAQEMKVTSFAEPGQTTVTVRLDTNVNATPLTGESEGDRRMRTLQLQDQAESIVLKCTLD